jgi:hypothetical protein
MLLYSQNITQVIRGKVYDNESQYPLPYATVAVLGTNPLLGTTSDDNGNFRMDDVPTGRYDIEVRCLGYEPAIISGVLVTSAKEVILSTGLKQAVTQMDEVTVKAYSKKDRPLNSMATISARSFSVEETRRYAGGVDDPARMASAFAGVTAGNIQDNAIIIRGNSPKGVLWRLEGVEIPNPNHFAGGNFAGGGVVTIFSSQLLANSDFFTGAFPAEYGNALAGVFDMKLRTGNNEKNEHAVQIGTLGVDIASEGPLFKNRNATYLFNYRYSTLSILSAMGLFNQSQIPKYQDLSFKLNFPTKKAGNFSLWGIGAIDRNQEQEEHDPAKWETDWDRIKYDWKMNVGAIGISHKIILSTKTYVNTTLAASGTRNIYNMDRLDDDLLLRPNQNVADKSGRITLSSFVNYKFNARLTLKTGFNYHSLLYNLDLSSTVEDNPETYQNFIRSNGHSSFTEYYAQFRYDIHPRLTVNGGINSSYFALNNQFAADPRLGIKWEMFPGHSVSFGYGKHRQLEDLRIYLIEKKVNGQTYHPNKNLKMSQSQHFVFAYDWMISDNLRLKIEPYYQYLQQIPGIPDSSYSMINFKQDWGFRDSLSNNCKGENIGVDFTLERFLNKGYYYLVTASLFDSKYKAADGIWRNTRYNKRYALNLLFGKEYNIKSNVLGLNGRLNYVGGERYSPIDSEQSALKKDVVYNENRAFDEQSDPMCYLDFTITYRINKKRYSGVWALQVKNVLLTPTFNGFDYNYKTKTVEKDQDKVILPVLSYKIEF